MNGINMRSSDSTGGWMLSSPTTPQQRVDYAAGWALAERNASVEEYENVARTCNWGDLLPSWGNASSSFQQGVSDYVRQHCRTVLEERLPIRTNNAPGLHLGDNDHLGWAEQFYARKIAMMRG